MKKFNNVNDCLQKWFDLKKNVTAIISNEKGNLKRVSYQELEILIKKYGTYFYSQGLRQGDLVVTSLIPSTEYAAVHFALLRLGCIPVIIDTGVSEQQKVACIQDSAPNFLISDNNGIRLSELYPKEFSSIRKKINVFDINLSQFLKNNLIPDISISIDDTLCLFFTSGSTGTPKATIWTQHNVISQITLQNENLDKLHNHNDLIIFPFFLLTSLLKGMTCIIPEINFGNPVTTDPLKFINAINQFGVTSGFASPTVWNIIMDYCISENINLESLKMVTTAGSPVDPNLTEKMSQIMTNAEIATPYGATEAILPITSINAHTLLTKDIVNKTLTGQGICLGKPVKTAKVLIIESLNDTVIPSWSKVKTLSPFKIGEIIVSGPMVTKGYYKNEIATKKSKIIQTSTNELYHRMGDLGYFDNNGNLWYCGRLKDAFISNNYTFYTANIESIFNSFHEIKKCAIIKLEELNLVCLIIESKYSQLSFVEEKIFNQIDRSSIPIDKVFVYNKSLPVDNRHNTKIERHLLKKELISDHKTNFIELKRVIPSITAKETS